jgi:hypothetical protein
MNFEMLKKRKLSNFLLQPLLQTKIGLYSIGLSFVFALLIGLICYVNLRELFGLIIEMTDAPREVQDIIYSYLSSMQAWIYLCLAGYIGITIAISIWYTHRLVGPTVAFRKHLEAIDKGEFGHRTVLRKSDAFSEVAEKLNELSANMKKRAELP